MILFGVCQMPVAFTVYVYLISVWKPMFMFIYEDDAVNGTSQSRSTPQHCTEILWLTSKVWWLFQYRGNVSQLKMKIIRENMKEKKWVTWTDYIYTIFQYDTEEKE